MREITEIIIIDILMSLIKLNMLNEIKKRIINIMAEIPCS